MHGVSGATSQGLGASAVVHGGPDALGVAPHDFSTNSNACGPCPEALHAVQSADASRYPDPAYAALRACLAALHGVDPGRVVLAGSASEFIHRATAFAARHADAGVVVPRHGYGDYAHAAQAWGLDVKRREPANAPPRPPRGLHWACEPSSPLGVADPSIAAWSEPGEGFAMQVLDCAYAPLRLDGEATPVPLTAWQLWTPNKALGLTGVRAAYAVAPARESPERLAALQALAPSWVVGAHGVALLAAWARPSVQQWLQGSLRTLREWKAQQQALCESLGWTVWPGSLANYFVARPALPEPAQLPLALEGLRAQGVKLRDCASVGLPGHVRLGVLAPPSQQALGHAWARQMEALAGIPAPTPV